MGLNSTRYRTFADDIQARKVARQIERNLMGITSNQGGRKQMKVKSEISKEEKLKNKITNLEDELDKVRDQNGRANRKKH